MNLTCRLRAPRLHCGQAWLALGILLACGAFLDAAQPQPARAAAATHDDDSWQVIYLGEQRIGYAHFATSQSTRDGQIVIHTRNETRMTIKRFGQELTIQTALATEETEQGDMLSFSMEMKNPPAQTSRTVGRVEGDKLQLETSLAGKTTAKSIDWDAEARSPAWQDRVLRQEPLKPGQSRSFKTFLPEFNKVTTVKIAADDYQFVKLLDGKSHKLLKVRIEQSVLPGLVLRGYLDETGDDVKTEMDFLGQTMTTYAVPAEEALKEIAEGGELDLAVNTLVRVERIPRAHKTQRAVYRLKLSDADAARQIPSGDSQAVRVVDDQTVEVVVRALPIPESARPGEADDKFVEATEFLQSGDARVKEHANRAAFGETDAARVARRMERYVHDQLKKKDFSTALASAAEVAENLQGDCTEHAVLLAAMLRAYRVPSRVAVGLVYVDSMSAFGGHMWTEAKLGERWIPLDATLGNGGVGAAHIKLAESSFADDGPAPITSFLPLLKLLGQLSIEVAESE